MAEKVKSVMGIGFELHPVVGAVGRPLCLLPLPREGTDRPGLEIFHITCHSTFQGVVHACNPHVFGENIFRWHPERCGMDAE